MVNESVFLINLLSLTIKLISFLQDFPRGVVWVIL